MSLYRETVNIYILTTKETQIAKYQKWIMNVITYPSNMRNMLSDHFDNLGELGKSLKNMSHHNSPNRKHDLNSWVTWGNRIYISQIPNLRYQRWQKKNHTSILIDVGNFSTFWEKKTHGIHPNLKTLGQRKWGGVGKLYLVMST